MSRLGNNILLAAAHKTSTPPPSGPPVSGYSAWWDATQITGVSDGEGVSEWADLSGNGYNWTQADTGYQPIYYNVTESQLVNGHPAVWFYPADQNCFDNTGPTYGAAQTVFLVGSGFTGTDAYLTGSSNSYSHGPAIIFGYTAGELQYYAELSSGTAADEQTFGTVNASTFAACWSQTDGSNLSGYLNNGTAVFSVTPHNANSGVVNEYLGTSVQSGSGNYASGAICEMIIYPSQLTATQIASVMSYLTSKWG